MNATSWKVDRPDPLYHPNFSMLDPELLLLFYNAVFESVLSQEVQNGLINEQQKQLWMSFVERKITSKWDVLLPFKKIFRVDENLDAQAAQVVQASKQWYQNKIQSGYVVERPSWGNQIGLVFRRP